LRSYNLIYQQTGYINKPVIPAPASAGTGSGGNPAVNSVQYDNLSTGVEKYKYL